MPRPLIGPRFMQESGYHDLKTNKLSREAMRAYLKERKDCTVIIVHAKVAQNLQDKENQDLMVAMNSVVVHSRFVDSIDELFIETCDLSFMRFFRTQLEELFDKALRDTHQLRYIIAFPMVCTEFLRSTSPFAPEERVSIGEMSVNTVNFFLELIAKETKSVMGMLCEERVLQDEELAPSNGAAYYFKEHPDKLKKKGKNTQLALVSPGKESLRKVVDETSTKDFMLRNLVDLCFSLNCFPSILVWDLSFVPREYLVSHLEDLLMKSLELYVNIDMQRVLTSVLLQETQPLDSKGDRTIASDYTTWYTTVLLKRVSEGGLMKKHFLIIRRYYLRYMSGFDAQMVNHIALQNQVCPDEESILWISFVFFRTQLEELFDKALRDTNQLRYIIAFPMVCTEFLRSTSPFAPEENLAELIGPYGIHYMGEKLMELVAAQVAEIKKLVIAYQDTLSFNKTQKS
ncbi:hypothetical protein EMCRGX_G010719 [Ephydatia muelleri]